MAGVLPICQSADYALSILLVSNIKSQLENFSIVLNEVGNEEKEDSVKVYTCESVSQIINLQDVPQADFVAFFVHEKRFNALHEHPMEKVKKNHLEDTYNTTLHNIQLTVRGKKYGGTIAETEPKWTLLISKAERTNNQLGKDSKQQSFITYTFQMLFVEQNILKLDQAFMFDRICLICDNVQTSGGFMPNILHLKHKYQLHALWGNLDAECRSISKRLLNLASAVCGAVTGFPLITHKVWHERCSPNRDFSTFDSEEDRTF